eukprot:404058-Pelagomonas_calceolata.AAC.6
MMSATVLKWCSIMTGLAQSCTLPAWASWGANEEAISAGYRPACLPQAYVWAQQGAGSALTEAKFFCSTQGQLWPGIQAWSCKI